MVSLVFQAIATSAHKESCKALDIFSCHENNSSRPHNDMRALISNGTPNQHIIDHEFTFRVLILWWINGIFLTQLFPKDLVK